MQLRYGVKFATNLGLHKGKVRTKVCSLQFPKAKATREGRDFSKARLFFCRDYKKPHESPYNTYIVVFWNHKFNLYKE